MRDKTANNRQSRISSELQEYINELVKEVVLNGKDFNSQKKWLKKYAEAESKDYKAIEQEILDFFELLKPFQVLNLKNNWTDINKELMYISTTVLYNILYEFSGCVKNINQNRERLQKENVLLAKQCKEYFQQLGVLSDELVKLRQENSRHNELKIAHSKLQENYEKLFEDIGMLSDELNMYKNSATM